MTQQCHRTGKGQSLFQTPRRVVLKNVQTIGQLHSSPMLVRLRSKSFKLGFSIMWIENFLMSKLHLEKAEEPESKLPTFTESQRKQGNSRKTSTSVSKDMLKPLTVWIITNCGKLLKRWDYQAILPVSWETCLWVKKQHLESYMEQLTGLGLRREYDKAVYCDPAYLTYMQSTSWEMLGWMKHTHTLKLESSPSSPQLEKSPSSNEDPL